MNESNQKSCNEDLQLMDYCLYQALMNVRLLVRDPVLKENMHVASVALYLSTALPLLTRIPGHQEAMEAVLDEGGGSVDHAFHERMHQRMRDITGKDIEAQFHPAFGEKP